MPDFGYLSSGTHENWKERKKKEKNCNASCETNKERDNWRCYVSCE